MADPFDIMLHIGVHKTATTHFQKLCMQQIDKFDANGLQFIGPNHLRMGIGKVPDIVKSLGREFHVAQGGNASEFQRVLISEENFIGPMVDQDKRPNRLMLYPDMEQQLKILQENAQNVPIHIAVATRNPSAYVASCYFQVLYGGHFCAWDDFIRRIQLKRYNWAEFVKRIVATGVAQSVTVWPYEEYAALLPVIIKRLTNGIGDVRKKMQLRRVHQGLSAAALKSIVESYDGTGDLLAVIESAQNEFPIGPGSPRFQPWGAHVLKRSRTRYGEQLREIEGLDGVTLLRHR